MKRFLLLCSITSCFFTTEAQTTHKQSKKKKKPTISQEAKMQARLDTLAAAKQIRIDSMLTVQLQADSARRMNDSLAYEKYQQERLAWIEQKAKETDSINKENGKTLSREHEQALAVKNEREVVSKAAKLNDYQEQQVNYINQLFSEKAKGISKDASLGEDAKKQQLSTLNDERRTRIRTVIGKGKERKLEKARKEHKNPIDTETQWINEVDSFAKS